MTKTEYVSNVYVGKHEKHDYQVTMLNPDVDEMFTVKGKQSLFDLCQALFDQDVKYFIYDLTAKQHVVCFKNETGIHVQPA